LMSIWEAFIFSSSSSKTSYDGRFDSLCLL